MVYVIAICLYRLYGFLYVVKMKNLEYSTSIPYYRGIGTIATKNPIVRQFAMLTIQALSIEEVKTAHKLGYPVTFKETV